MIDSSKLYSVPKDVVEDIVMKESRHPYYSVVLDRAKIMNSWFQAEYDEYTAISSTVFSDKSYIIAQSTIESNDEYKERLARMKLFPLEQKFFSAQQRIYDENNVNRSYPDNKEFWMYKESNFDDAGCSITEFYRDKVLFVKEVLGFGAVVTDLMMDGNGDPVTDNDGNVVPYNFVVRPHEIWNFEVKQGMLTLLVTRQMYYDIQNVKKHKWTAYTPEYICVYIEENGVKKKTLEIPNPFGEVPATLLKGQTDANSSFIVGKPRRYSLKGMYLAASELFYDLKKGSELFGHPIPVLTDSIVRSLAGVADDDQYDSRTIKEGVGMAIIIPDEQQIPNNMLYQADMQGLQHLRDVIFSDLMSLIFLMAQVRDKSIVKSNVSGSAKRFDNVEEQGLLASTAMDMEMIEMQVLKRMAKVRDEDPSDYHVTYSKHYDLSSAAEIFSDITEGMQYHVLPLPLLKKLTGEYMRKRSMPQEDIQTVMDHFDEFGIPKTSGDLRNLIDILPQEELQRQAELGIDLNSEQ
tara:strand:+ start:499 stop:2058 length:1560 start_codon:yes stop_codon:yes gene_type:complete